MEVDEDWPDPESGWDRGDRYWLNEIIAVDGAPVMNWNDQEYPVVGQADEF